MLDPTIPLQVKPPQIASPMQTMGDVLSLRSAQQRIQNEGLQQQSTQLNLDEAQRRQHDEITTQGILKKYYNADTGVFDQAGAIGEMRKLVPDQALAYQEKFDQGLVSHINATQVAANQRAEALDTVNANLNGFDPDAPDAATKFASIYPTIKAATVDQGLMSQQDFDKYVPATYDAKAIKTLQTTFPSLQSAIKRTQSMAENARLAHENRANAEQFRTYARQMLLDGIAGLSTDKSSEHAQAAWTTVRDGVTQIAGPDKEALKVAEQLLKEFGPKFDDDLVDRAAKIEMGPAGLKAAAAASKRDAAAAERNRETEISMVQRRLQIKPSEPELYGFEPPPIGVEELQDKIAAIDTTFRNAASGPNGEDVKPAIANRAKEFLAGDMKALQARWDAYNKKVKDAADEKALKDAPTDWSKWNPFNWAGKPGAAPVNGKPAAPPVASPQPDVSKMSDEDIATMRLHAAGKPTTKANIDWYVKKYPDIIKAVRSGGGR